MARTRRTVLLVALALLTALVSAPAESPASDEFPAPADSAASAETPAPPDSAALLIAEARRASDAGRFAEAAAALERALSHDPDQPAALSLLARVQAWGRSFDASLATYRRLLALDPANATDRAGYARALAWSGRHRESIAEFRRAVRDDSTNLETRVGLARVLSWSGDLAGAAEEYRRILKADPDHGDAWLGLATVARWRGAPTASDAFLERAEARGAERSGIDEEREAVRVALRPSSGTGWMRARERQYVGGSPAFTIGSVGPFLHARTTLGRSLDVRARAARLHRYEIGRIGGFDSLNYDLRSSLFEGDLHLLRYYPVQITAGATLERLEPRSAGVRHPLGTDDQFVGARSRVWAYWGRLIPSAGVRREFIPVKTVHPITGARRLDAGGVTNAEAALTWSWSGSGTATGSFAKGLYSDDNERTTAHASATYRFRARQPNLTVDYAWAWTDFSFPSPSYFTPLESVRHVAGLSANGYSERGALDYGARYELSYVVSSNFADIATNGVSAYADAVLFGAVPLGIEGSYSVDNNDYHMWGLTLSGSVRW